MTKKNFKPVAGDNATDEQKIAVDNMNAEIAAEEKAEEQKNLLEQPSEEQLEFARINTRKEFNKKFSKWAEIEPENADDDFIALAKKEFEDEVEVHKNEKFKIVSAEDGLALKYAEFLREWNAKFNKWEKGMWRGIIRFEQVIGKIVDELKADDKKDFEIDYATLIFLYNAMMTPNGVGLESARTMAKFENYNEETDAPFEENIPVTYSGIVSIILEKVKYLGAVDKKLNIMKQRVELAYAGLRMKFKISSLEEFIEFNDAITKENMPTDEEIQQTARE
jgi:hypothetical protein